MKIELLILKAKYIEIKSNLEDKNYLPPSPRKLITNGSNP